ncbi:MAG: adenylate cyclase, partial [Bacteroidota bacterium]
NIHFNEDWLMIEKKFLDETRDRFHPIITDFLRRTQPVVRYELNDIIHPGPPCSCGLASMTIARIEGRSDDVFRFTNTKGENCTIYPDFLRRAVIGASDFITDYRVSQVSDRQMTYYLEVETGTEVEPVKQKVEQALKQLLGRLGLEFVEVTYTAENTRIPGAKRIRIHNAYRPTI